MDINNDGKVDGADYMLFDMLFGDDDKNKSDYTEEELDSYGLTEEEKEEVRKGNQDPWDFEEEDMDDDDYYSEDD